MAFALSTNWFGHSNGVKIWLPGTGTTASSKHAMVIHLRGGGTAPQRWDATVSAGVKNLGGNDANGDRAIVGSPQNALPRGTWHTCEMLYTLNTADQADGEVRVWMDGALVVSATNLAVRGVGAITASNDRIVVVDWVPTYGGGTSSAGPVPAPGASLYMGYAGVWKL